MKAMRLAGLAVLLAVGVTLFASGPVQAGKGKPGPGSYAYELCNTGIEPVATGYCTLKEVDRQWTPSGWISVYEATITCRDLTPGASYSACGQTFTARGNGNGRAAFTIYRFPGFPFYLGVDRLDPSGPVTVLYAGTAE